jgi:hypothetical protein
VHRPQEDKRYPDTCIGLDTDTLCAIGLFNGSLVQVRDSQRCMCDCKLHGRAATCGMPQVSNPARPDVVPHLATVTALQPQSLLPGSPAACSADGLPCGLLPPLLAYNLGLSYHLAPLISPADSTPLLRPQQPGLVSLQQCEVVLKPFSSKGSAGSAALASAAQHATSVCIASVRVPCEDLLLTSSSHAKEGEGATAHEAGHAGDMVRGGAPAEQEAHREGDDEGAEAAGDHLVEALQDYFARMPRWVLPPLSSAVTGTAAVPVLPS